MAHSRVLSFGRRPNKRASATPKRGLPQNPFPLKEVNSRSFGCRYLSKSGLGKTLSGSMNLYSLTASTFSSSQTVHMLPGEFPFSIALGLEFTCERAMFTFAWVNPSNDAPLGKTFRSSTWFFSYHEMIYRIRPHRDFSAPVIEKTGEFLRSAGVLLFSFSHFYAFQDAWRPRQETLRRVLRIFPWLFSSIFRMRPPKDLEMIIIDFFWR